MVDQTGLILAAIERLDFKIDRLDARVEQLEVGLAAARADIAATRADVATTRADIAGTRADIMERIDRVPHKLDQTNDDIVVNYGAADRAERMARTAIDEGRQTNEIMRVMQRQIMRLTTDVNSLKDRHP
jgi:hypothetical protein